LYFKGEKPKVLRKPFILSEPLTKKNPFETSESKGRRKPKFE